MKNRVYALALRTCMSRVSTPISWMYLAMSSHHRLNPLSFMQEQTLTQNTHSHAKHTHTHTHTHAHTLTRTLTRRTHTHTTHTCTVVSTATRTRAQPYIEHTAPCDIAVVTHSQRCTQRLNTQSLTGRCRHAHPSCKHSQWGSNSNTARAPTMATVAETSLSDRPLDCITAVRAAWGCGSTANEWVGRMASLAHASFAVRAQLCPQILVSFLDKHFGMSC